VYAERGRNGGWALAEPYRTDLTGLTEAELRSLVLATAPAVLGDLGLGKAADRALLKVFATLPEARRKDAEAARRDLHVDPTGWRSPAEAAPLLPLLDDALRRERRVRMTYQRAFTESPVERTADPLGLVANGSVWYLVALVDGRLRTYRASRIRELTLLDERSERPDDFDLAAAWAASRDEFRAQIPRVIGRIRVSTEGAQRVRGWWRFVEIASESRADDGWICFEVRWDSVGVAVEYVLGLGGEVEVLEPVDLRERVVAAARGLLLQHGVQLA
jgi:predicted DNA-binding transcriptional regulator YafY